MPTITISKKALQAALKKKLTDEELRDRIAFLGTDLERIDGDDIDVEIFPNRPDLLSQQGFERAFTAFVGDRAGLKKYHVKKGGEDARVIIDPSVKDVRPYTACAIIKGMTFTDQHIKDVIQVQEKLHVTYGRNRKRCAIGIYPLEHITLPITYAARKPEDIRFQPLESSEELTGPQILSQHPAGREYGRLLEGEERFPVFMDAKGEVLSMPPIINSEKTGKITEKTRDVFIECSGFSWHVVHGAISIITAAMIDMGGKAEEMRIEYPKALGGLRESPQMTPWRLPFKRGYVNKYLGYDLDEGTTRKLLGRMGIGCEEGSHGNDLVALIPSYRTDIIHPIDLVEDLAIAHGMENIASVIPDVATVGEEDALEGFKAKLREILSGLGLIEIKNYNLTAKEEQTALFRNGDEDLVRVAGAASKEYDTLRKLLLPSGLRVLQRNKHHEYPQNVFELGDVFWQDDEQETGVGEGMRLSVLVCGEDAEYTKIRQVLDSLCEALSFKAEVHAHESSHFITGRAGTISIKGEKLGSIGEISPEVLEGFELGMPAAAFELDVALIFSLVDKEVKL
ncbi:phenylalanine--tRNA ligase subunit beta [Candidatus Woesearchaeota archaeon]|nr:phenylalanine--tRNA ligase subunit beta [Candidatus Woesearchaeota archaeon]